MPEYLAPGVYVEEVSYRAKSIEGVSTSIAGFIGSTRFGPVGGEPELLTSFADYERVFGGFDNLVFRQGSATDERINYMAHAVRAFFDNGGSKLYVTRVYGGDATSGSASTPVVGRNGVTLRARFPGRAGAMRVVFAVKASPLVSVSGEDGRTSIPGVREYDVVYISQTVSAPAEDLSGFYDVVREGDELVFRNGSRTERLDGSAPRLDADTGYHRITLTVRVQKPDANSRFGAEEVLGEFAPHPRHRNAVSEFFSLAPTSRSRSLTVPFAIAGQVTSGADLLEALIGGEVKNALERRVNDDGEPPRPSELERMIELAGGNDGSVPNANDYRGSATGLAKTGLETFADIEEISIVAAPGASADYAGHSQQRISQITQHLLTHVERMRYRVAVIDAPAEVDPQNSPGMRDLTLSEIRNHRGRFDSTHAAFYYPWVRILDPLDPDGRREITLPPSGFVSGIYARNDTENGVHKAPANEVVRGAIGFGVLLNKAQQDVLNPEGVNCFRFFEGRGYRLWGARTISSDPEWKYISVRRYFAYLEHSIDRGTQWAVFENNNEPLWANIRRTIEDFLINEWRNGALMGAKPEQAFFVRCDRSTMTQNDLDNGRLVCLIGVAVVKPAEFVIFRIGQWTADHQA